MYAIAACISDAARYMSWVPPAAGLHIAEDMVHFRIGHLRNVSEPLVMQFIRWIVWWQLFYQASFANPQLSLLCMQSVAMPFLSRSFDINTSSDSVEDIAQLLHGRWSHTHNTTQQWYTVTGQTITSALFYFRLYVYIIMFGFPISLLLQFPFVCIVCSLLIKVLYLQGHEQGRQCVCVRRMQCNIISILSVALWTILQCPYMDTRQSLLSCQHDSTQWPLCLPC